MPLLQQLLDVLGRATYLDLAAVVGAAALYQITRMLDVRRHRYIWLPAIPGLILAGYLAVKYAVISLQLNLFHVYDLVLAGVALLLATLGRELARKYAHAAAISFPLGMALVMLFALSVKYLVIFLGCDFLDRGWFEYLLFPLEPFCR